MDFKEGQCGACGHFGEEQKTTGTFHDFVTVQECGLEQNKEIALKVTAISGCNQFVPADK